MASRAAAALQRPALELPVTHVLLSIMSGEKPKTKLVYGVPSSCSAHCPCLLLVLPALHAWLDIMFV